MKLKDRERREIKKEETIKVYSDDNFCIVIPKTHMSAKVYSFGTTWCTTDENCFNSYDFPLFIIIDKNNSSEGRQKKYQLHFETESFQSETCEELNFSEFISERPQLKELFTTLIQENTYKEYRDIEVMLSMEFMEMKQILITPIEFASHGLFCDADLDL